MNWRRPLFVSLCALATPVWAHTALERSEPKDGAVLPRAPREIQLWFSEPIKTGLSTIEVRDAAGRQVDQRDLRADKKEPALVHLPLIAEVAPGSYKVIFSAVAQDLHVTRGEIRFTISPAAK